MRPRVRDRSGVAGSLGACVTEMCVPGWLCLLFDGAAVGVRLKEGVSR
jgi:hypothetical protein